MAGGMGDRVGGCVLNHFQTADSEGADHPTIARVLIEAYEDRHISVERGTLEQKWKESLEGLAKTSPKEKIFASQITLAYCPSSSISKEGNDEIHQRARWSPDFSPVPFLEDYLPFVDVAKVVLKTRFRGWFSMEILMAERMGAIRGSGIRLSSLRRGLGRATSSRWRIGSSKIRG
jgi:hypothetical protein